ncbi:MAG: PDZ domain-containing protein [Saprospiraceae bacterium]|nr:PDZ domain-containing protein [Saprospiraceae bacterium]
MESPNKHRYEIWQPLLLALVLAGGMLLGTRLDDELPNLSKPTFQQKQEDPWDELKKVIGFIESRYGDSLPVDSISHEAISMLVQQLDPHSYYLSGLEYQNFKEKMMGSYIGIGIDYNIIDDTMYLLRVIPNSPAERAGLKKGDQVIEIDSVKVSGEGMDQKASYQVWKGTNRMIKLGIWNGQHMESFEVEKGPVDIYSVSVGTMVDSTSGYIKIDRFASDTYREFMDHVEGLVHQGMKNLIIDVRENPGGSLDQVIKIINQLVNERDQLLLYTEGLHTKRVEYKSTGKIFFPLDQIAVIINENSVSASEVLAGVLQDLGRATIIGRRSFGKGLVQEMYDLTPESAINLTVARYYLPSGRSIQKSYVDRNAYEEEVDDRFLNGELFTSDSIAIDPEHAMNDSQGKLRPSGEGIVPDVFVPADSFYFTKSWKLHEPMMYSDAFKFYLQHHNDIASNLEAGNNLDTFSNLIMHRPVFSNDHQLDTTTRDKLLRGYYHLLKWHHYGEARYFEDKVNDDDEIKTAMEVFRGDTIPE